MFTTMLLIIIYYTAWELTVIHVNNKILLQEPFEISQGINGSPTSYTLTYSDPFLQVTCGQFVIMANTCINETCINVLNISKLSCPHDSNIIVEVYATNVLGNGPTTVSHPSVLGKWGVNS